MVTRPETVNGITSYAIINDELKRLGAASSSIHKADEHGATLESSLQDSDSSTHVPLWTRAPPMYGLISIRNGRDAMEDGVVAIPSFVVMSDEVFGCSSCGKDHVSGNTPLHFYAVFDGHGGDDVSQACVKRVHVALAEKINQISGDPRSNGLTWDGLVTRALAETFCAVDSEVTNVYVQKQHRLCDGPVHPMCMEVVKETAGSTSVVAVVGPCQVIIGNCGDSRAVLSRGGKAIPVTIDQKPNREDEVSRVEAAGGVIFHWNGQRVQGVLAMTRAIGDKFLKPFVIPDPEITFIQRRHDDECLIIASDGLWDVVSNEQACHIARSCILSEVHPEEAAATLTKLAISRNSGDNISIIVLDLRR